MNRIKMLIKVKNVDNYDNEENTYYSDVNYYFRCYD